MKCTQIKIEWRAWLNLLVKIYETTTDLPPGSPLTRRPLSCGQQSQRGKVLCKRAYIAKTQQYTHRLPADMSVHSQSLEFDTE